MSEPRFFRSQKQWRAWLEKNHDKKTELLLGFHKVSSGKSGIAYKEALDEALCFGWIDARRNGGETTWTIRFTPRKARSIWSAINIKRIAELKAAGLMHPAGITAYEKRDPELQKRYSYENRSIGLTAEYEKQFRANRRAWDGFHKMPPSYRHPAIWWVMSARQEETRQRRLKTLIADSAVGMRIKPLRPPEKKPAAKK